MDCYAYEIHLRQRLLRYDLFNFEKVPLEKRWLEVSVANLTCTSYWVVYLQVIQEAVWPGGVLPVTLQPERSQQQKDATKKQALDCLMRVLPDLVSDMLGSDKYKLTWQSALDSFQDSSINRHLVYCLLDLLLDFLVPEIPEEDFQRSLLQAHCRTGWGTQAACGSSEGNTGEENEVEVVESSWAALDVGIVVGAVVSWEIKAILCNATYRPPFEAPSARLGAVRPDTDIPFGAWISARPHCHRPVGNAAVRCRTSFHALALDHPPLETIPTRTSVAELAVAAPRAVGPGEVAGLTHQLPAGFAGAPQLGAGLHVGAGLGAEAEGQLALPVQAVAGAR
ncbi:unnamed protein product [Menidia menidia]|uniref:(Atlantic silverside) hypothetical protein n=1 Tax=Menidia menidia TaxID=238744 RepID=A0A8S4BTE6_9TELE|nr:unnamed protein product [Menidia menidia]